jgi:hypothetical protein
LLPIVAIIRLFSEKGYVALLRLILSSPLWADLNQPAFGYFKKKLRNGLFVNVLNIIITGLLVFSQDHLYRISGYLSSINSTMMGN